MIGKIAVSTLLATCAFAQSEMEDKLKAEARSKMMVYSIDNVEVSPVAGAPYSADETTTTTQMLFDGNRIVNTSATKVYRDQQGRTRVERTLSNIGPVSAAGQPSVNITINDPVAGVHYMLDAGSKTAFKSTHGGSPDEANLIVKMKNLVDDHKVVTTQARTESGTFTLTTSQSARSFTSAGRREDLGNSNMAGVPVTGSRTTTVIPAGTMGNDRDITITEERWYSPDLKMNIMTKHSDPRMGETVFQVNNLTRSNPDPSLFQVPADYQIKEGPQAGLRVITKD
jgi:hypothetical protein